MAVLTTRTLWRRPDSNGRRALRQLTLEEAENVRVALRSLAKRFGTCRALGVAMGVGTGQVKNLCSRSGRPSAQSALSVARLADVPVDDVLTGRWPPAGACPHCGRCPPESQFDS
ncbi:MAG: hypothetical protein ACHREM_03125 [Polyangiales bacterium]